MLPGKEVFAEGLAIIPVRWRRGRREEEMQNQPQHTHWHLQSTGDLANGN